MYAIKSAKFYNKSKSAAVKYIISVFLICSFGFSLLRFPEINAKAVTDAIFMCIKSVIPSLFPFMVVSSVLVSSSANSLNFAFLEKLSRFVFRQPAISLSVILFSQIGGFPVGATLINQLYKEKKITLNQSRRLLLFCINPGPAFVISYVGSSILSSRKAGIIIYASVVVSSLTLGVISRFFADNSEIFEPHTASTSVGESSVIEAIVQGVKKSAVSMGEICGWIIIFNCINSIIALLNLSAESKSFISAILEVTGACRVLGKGYPLTLIAGAIGWSGLCVHFQIMTTIILTKLKFRYFIVARIINSAFSVIICHTLLKIFPVSIATSALASKSVIASANSIPVSFGLIFMCLIILSGDNFVIKRKVK